nr:AAA family ATPase [Kyrpidia tusciae]
MNKTGKRPSPAAERILHRYVQGELALAEALRQLYAFPSRTPEHFRPARSTTQVVDPGHFRLPTVKTAEDGAKRTSADSYEDLFREMLDELNRFIGLHRLKNVLHEAFAFAEIQRRREELNLKAEPVVWHMIFQGNPGTGKTTMARFMAKWLHRFGILSKGQLVEVERADLVGEYIGHTAQKTREQIQRALGGVLFVDEAYSLARGGPKDFGREAVDTLVKAAEDHRTDLVVVLAGYPREMEAFLRLNPGLPSRFPIQLHFDDYSVDELLAIADRMLAEREYRLSPDARRRLSAWLSEQTAAGTCFGNARFGNARLVRNVLERALRRQAHRLLREGIRDREALMTLRAEDFIWEVGER